MSPHSESDKTHHPGSSGIWEIVDRRWVAVMTEADAYNCHKKPRFSSGWLAARRRDCASKRWTSRDAAMKRDSKINLSQTATLPSVAIETPERSSMAGDRERTPPCLERQPQGVFGSPHCFELVPGFDELGSVRHSRNVFQQRPPTSHQQDCKREREREMGRSIRLSTIERRESEGCKSLLGGQKGTRIGLTGRSPSLRVECLERSLLFDRTRDDPG